MPGLAGNVGVAPLEIADQTSRSWCSSSRATRPPTWRFRPTSPASPISRPSTLTGTATSSAIIADKLNLIDRDTPFPVALGRGAHDHPLVLEALRERSPA